MTQISFVVFVLAILPRALAMGAHIGTNTLYSNWKAERGATAFTHCKLLSKSLGATDPTDTVPEDSFIAFHWTIQNDTIRIAVAVEAVGWVALGFAEMGGMPGSDIVVFEITSKKVLDTYSVAYERPRIDQQQDWKLLNYNTSDEGMIFEAERKLDTGDNMDWPITDDSSLLEAGTRLLVAWGETREMSYHSPDNRLQATVRLFAEAGVNKDNDFVESVMSKESEGSVSLLMDNFLVPRWRTYYKWKCVTVADLVKDQGLPSDTPLHLIGFEFDLDPGSLVHHIAVYSDTREKISVCNPLLGPTSQMYTWNRGQSKTLFFPENVGMLLADETQRAGQGLGVPPKSFRLEVHYENPRNIEGSKDNSGVRLHYTSKLRKYTGAALELADPQVKLVGEPIGDGLRQHTFTCPASCTKMHLPPQGATVLYEMFHMHKRGLTMEISHHRDGKKVWESGVQYYDFSSGGQITRANYTILPGDSFETRCTYDGDKKLQFGVGADKEMCLGGIFYYPASASAHMSCTMKSTTQECASDHSATSIPERNDLARTFGIEAPLVGKPGPVISSTVEPLLAEGKRTGDKPGSISSQATKSKVTFNITLAVCPVLALLIAIVIRMRRVRNLHEYNSVAVDSDDVGLSAIS